MNRTIGTTWLNVKLYDDEDIATEYPVMVQWEYVSGIMGEGGDWYTNIVKFPEDISEETKESLRTEVHYMQEDIMGIGYDTDEDYNPEIEN